MEPIINAVTNDDLAQRLDQLEAKMDSINTRMEQAMGAWFFIKILCSFALGLAVIGNIIKEWFK